MKNEQQQQARHLFLDTNLSKSEIADKVGVDRRTIRIWSQQHNWENLRRSSRHLPSMVAEKCYYLIDQFASHLLSENNTGASLNHKDASAINSIASAIKKLKARSAINESMEMFNFFMEDVKRKDEKMAEAISPFIEDYFANREAVSIADFQLSGFDATGRRTWADEEKEIRERWEDEKDNELMHQELHEQQVAEERRRNPPEPEYVLPWKRKENTLSAQDADVNTTGTPLHSVSPGNPADPQPLISPVPSVPHYSTPGAPGSPLLYGEQIDQTLAHSNIVPLPAITSIAATPPPLTIPAAPQQNQNPHGTQEG